MTACNPVRSIFFVATRTERYSQSDFIFNRPSTISNLISLIGWILRAYSDNLHRCISICIKKWIGPYQFPYTYMYLCVMQMDISLRLLITRLKYKIGLWIVVLKNWYVQWCLLSQRITEVPKGQQKKRNHNKGRPEERSKCNGQSRIFHCCARRFRVRHIDSYA